MLRIVLEVVKGIRERNRGSGERRRQAHFYATKTMVCYYVLNDHKSNAVTRIAQPNTEQELYIKKRIALLVFHQHSVN